MYARLRLSRTQPAIASSGPGSVGVDVASGSSSPPITPHAAHNDAAIAVTISAAPRL
jgi:hypothetical protein